MMAWLKSFMSRPQALAPPPGQTIELAHAVLDRRRATKEHNDMVQAIISSPDAFGAMVQHMRSGHGPNGR